MLKYDNEEPFEVVPDFINRTWIYLKPSIVLMKNYNPYFADLKANLMCASFKDESLILYYNRGNTPGIKKLLDSLKGMPEFIGHWMHSENAYAIQIKPDINFSAFEEGRYTDIYTALQINQVFTPTSKARKVLAKDPAYKQVYVDLLNKWFNTHNTIEYLESREGGKSVEISQYDIPPCMNQEILGYENIPGIRKGKLNLIKQLESYNHKELENEQYGDNPTDEFVQYFSRCKPVVKDSRSTSKRKSRTV